MCREVQYKYSFHGLDVYQIKLAFGDRGIVVLDRTSEVCVQMCAVKNCRTLTIEHVCGLDWPN